MSFFNAFVIMEQQHQQDDSIQNKLHGLVLIIDDLEANRYLYANYLEAGGFRIVCAASAQEAQQLLTDLSPDVILMDVNLPDMSGYELCSLLKENPSYRQTPIVQVSAAFVTSQDFHRGIESGADAYLTTPVDSLVLVNTIRSWMRVRNTYRELVDSRNLYEAVKLQGRAPNQVEFKTIIDAIPQIIWSTDESGRSDYLNVQWKEFTGRDQYSFEDSNWDLIHEDDRDQMLKAWESRFHTNSSHFEYEFRLRHHSGEFRWMLTRAVALRNSQGKVIRWMGTTTEIHELKMLQKEMEQHHEQIRQRQQMLSLLAKTSVEVNSQISLEEKLDLLTRKAREIMRANLANIAFVPGGNWSKAVVKISMSNKYDKWQDFSEAPTGEGITQYVCTSNSVIRLSEEELKTHPHWRNFTSYAETHPPLRGLLAVPLIQSDGTNIGLIQVSDKNEGEFTEEDESILTQLAHAAAFAIENDRLLQRERQTVRNRDEFISIASHELKTPLTSLKLETQLMDYLLNEVEHHPGPQEMQLFTKKVSQQVDKVSDFVNLLLDVSRIRSGRLILNREKLDMGQVVREVIQLLNQQFSLYPTGAPEVIQKSSSLKGFWDRTRLEQVLTNLLVNATKYGDEKPIQVILERQGENLLVEVKDEGIGIPESDIEMLFSLYESGSRSLHKEGLGLGLYISKKIVQAHGGRIWAESGPEGTSFFVELPENEK